MKVLLVGEYSNVFTELSKELKKRDITVFCISDGDAFKNYPTDYKIKHDRSNENFIKKIFNKVLFRLGLDGIFTFLKNWNKLKQLSKGYDIVQLINPIALSGFGSIPNLLYLRYLKNNNKRIYLSVLGDDYYTVNWFAKNDFKSNYYRRNKLRQFVNPDWAFKYKYCFLYHTLNRYAIHIANRIIPGLRCYREPYKWTGKVTKVVPFPVNPSNIGTPFKMDENAKIVIFHGWQKGREHRKGNDVFDEVVKQLLLNYHDKLEYEVVQSVPYDEYVKLFGKCHIFLDQLYFEDKGYNGMLGMAAGKVVFSGFYEKALEEYPVYHGEFIGIDSSNDKNALYLNFERLINNPQELEQISDNAIRFIKNNHLSEIVTDMYIEIWKQK